MMSNRVSAANPFIVRLPLDQKKRGVDIWSATVAFEQREDGVYTGVSLRSPKDVYDGALGDRIAIGRVQNENSWYFTWDMLPYISEITLPNIPVQLYRFWAPEVAWNFVERNIKENREEIYQDLGIIDRMRVNYEDSWEYEAWCEKQEVAIIKHVYG